MKQRMHKFLPLLKQLSILLMQFDSLFVQTLFAFRHVCQVKRYDSYCTVLFMTNDYKAVIIRILRIRQAELLRTLAA